MTRLKLEYRNSSFFADCLSILNWSLYEELPVVEQLLENYDRRVRPGYGTPKPVDIYVNIFVNSFGAVSAETMDYKVIWWTRKRP